MDNYFKIIGVIILLVFYTVYLGKMMLQKRKGIQTDQIAKGKEKGKRFYIELVMKAATYTVVAAEVISIFAVTPSLPFPILVIGVVLGFAGDVIFMMAVVTMRDSWRAGIAENDKTEIITNGIYMWSRNPGFLGFDCVYLGLLLLFFHPLLLVFSVWAMVMLHLQILQEEKFLLQVFGGEYAAYQGRVCRYFGRKK